MKEKINWKSLLWWVIGTVAAGFLGGLIGGAMKGYGDIVTPSFAPPPFLFPIVWSVLYILMGVSAYIVFESDSINKKPALTIYFIQLAVNILWPLFFFRFEWFLFSFIWLIALLVLVLIMFSLFYKIKPLSAWLQLPYILWLAFAAVLNFTVYTINP